jgi:RimJ/RimL family protein N-acetyltransferase
MAALDFGGPWPPAAITTDRMVLRASEARDRERIIDLFSSAAVYTYLGGARPRDELERVVPGIPGQRPGFFVADLDGTMIGTVMLDRRDADRPGHLHPDGGEAELSYLFLPHAWGHGYACESCAAVLEWFADSFPAEPVVLCTQTANIRSRRVADRLGFSELERFEEYGAEQWFGGWGLPW